MNLEASVTHESCVLPNKGCCLMRSSLHSCDPFERPETIFADINEPFFVKGTQC